MNVKLLMMAVFLFSFTLLFAQDSIKVCEPLDKTFHHLQNQNLNIHVGTEYNGFWYNNKVYSVLNAQLVVNYLPFSYTEAGYRFKPSLVTYFPPGNKFSLQHSVYLRKYLLSVSCGRYSVFAEGALHTNNNKISFKGNEVSKGQFFPSMSFGFYKMISSKLQFNLAADLLFGRQPNQTSVSMLWNLKNGKFKRDAQSKIYNYQENLKQ